MNPILRDMFDHQLWADSVLWGAIGAHAPSRTDPAIFQRLHHIHLVQRVFMWAAGGGKDEFTLTKPEDFPDFHTLEEYAHGSHDAIRRFLTSMTPERLDERLNDSIIVPWFKDPPLTITVTEALTQCAMHSHHHRGQNATRLRELGGVPPSTDLIVWYWKGRPGSAW
jgi:uncharacterized damage-inducible protein DinB